MVSFDNCYNKKISPNDLRAGQWISESLFDPYVVNDLVAESSVFIFHVVEVLV